MTEPHRTEPPLNLKYLPTATPSAICALLFLSWFGFPSCNCSICSSERQVQLELTGSAADWCRISDLKKCIPFWASHLCHPLSRSPSHHSVSGHLFPLSLPGLRTFIWQNQYNRGQNRQGTKDGSPGCLLTLPRFTED